MRHLLVGALAILGCGDNPKTPLPDAPPPPDAAPDAPRTCIAPTGAGTMHGGSVMTDETWTEAASPHVLPFDTSIYAHVTIEPCAVVRLAAGRQITIPGGGALTAAGAPGLPVTIEPSVAGAAWSEIRALGGDLSLAHAIVRGGGEPLATNPAYAGAILMQTTTTGTLHVDDVEIADSKSQGVYIDGNTGFDATSQDLRVHGSVGAPVHVYARVIGSVPTGTYTGNGKDVIVIAGAGGAVVDNQTMHDRGVPYHVGSGMDGGRMDVNAIAAGSVAVLTIEAGVIVQFPAGGTLNIESQNGTAAARGALIAIGTDQKKIVFTSDSATPLAGDWLGLGFGSDVSPQTSLSHVKVEYAGGAGTGSNSCPYPGRVGQNDAAIRIFGPPQTQFITNTEIIASARDGIDRGWRADLQPDFLPTNSFGVAACKQSTPRTSAGVCPPNPPCP